MAGRRGIPTFVRTPLLPVPRSTAAFGGWCECSSCPVYLARVCGEAACGWCADYVDYGRRVFAQGAASRAVTH